MGRLVQRFGRVIPGELLDARGGADAILRGARVQAEAVVTAARGEAAAIREEARRAGEAEGRAASAAEFTTLLVAARADAELVRAAAIPSARALARRMAEKIVGRTVETDPAVLVNIAGEALMAARARAGVVLLRVHPADLLALEAARPVLASRLASATELRLVADAAVGRAGCIVETPVGRLDARLDTQLNALERAIFGGVAGGGADEGTPP